MIFLYLLFAFISTAVNICTQLITIWMYEGAYSIELSIIAGTIMGLPTRYALDKKFIFKYKVTNYQNNKRLFFLYSLAGVFTTMIFWITEYLFHLIFLIPFMRYLGGILGLCIGFYIKYHLDKRFVFIDN